MKTRERILMTSLQLFNEEGEPHVTTVDIANEMDISPGNLYYHFKGKEMIVDELFVLFESEVLHVLQAPIEKSLELEDNWYYLYVLFELLYKYRFLYLNQSEIFHKYESIRRPFRRILNLKNQTAKSIIQSLLGQGVLNLTKGEMEFLSNQISLTVTYWFNFSELHRIHDERLVLHQGVFQVMSLIAPYLEENHGAFYETCREFYEKATRT